jgi:hypothetical protein
MGKRGPTPVNHRILGVWYAAWFGVLEGMRRGRWIRGDLTFKSEEILWKRLMEVETPREVKAVCDQSEFWLNPKKGAGVFHHVLSKQAVGFLAAKKDPRYPRSDRPTNIGKRNRFLARALAGLTMGISSRTAQDLLAKTDIRLRNAFRHPLCVCGHRKQHHQHPGCIYCSCTEFRFSGGVEYDHPTTGESPSDSTRQRGEVVKPNRKQTK